MVESIPINKKPPSVIGSALRLGSLAVASLRTGNAALDSTPLSSLLAASSGVQDSRSDLDCIFHQHPDLFRDSSQISSPWETAFHAPAPHGIRTLLVRAAPAHAQAQAQAQAQSQWPLRESILADSRLHFCGMAERLGDACRQIRQHNFQVIVFAMGEHTQDMLPLLELMNGCNPRAKAIAVLDRQVSKGLQQMIHPKVLGYVAAQDVCSHLTDAVMEVSQGRFTASPAMSSIVMRLTTRYLKTPSNAPSTPLLATAVAKVPLHVDGFDAASEKYASSSRTSHFAPANNLGHSVGGTRQLLSERESQVLQLVAGGLSSNDIALELGISVPTVNSHMRNIFTKLNVRTRAQAIHVGIAHGLILVT
jgi:DNA-binding NarL/FixJ family response regulator